MKLPALAIRNHQFTSIVTLLLVLLGVVSLLTMPRSEDPQFDFPNTFTTVVYPGTNPLDMEKLVVDPIEAAINQIEDIKVIKTQIEDGLAIINTEFLYGSDPDKKFDDVVSAIQAIREQLPQELQLLKTQKASPADVYILQLALVSQSATYRDLRFQAEKLEQRLERVSGVKQADIIAFPRQEVQVRMDVERMRQRGIGVDQVIAALQQAGANIPGGHVNSEDKRFTVRLSGDYKDLDEIRRTVVAAREGHLVYLEDLASIRQTDGIPSYLARFNGEPAVFISVMQRKGSNIFDIMTGLKQQIAQFESTLPGSMRIDVVMDQTNSVSERIDGFFNSLLQGLVLVGVMTLLVLGFRASLVIVLAIPLSVMIGIGWVDMAGFGLQQMTIVGLVIALGLLVDNAIVVTENVGRLLRQGVPHQEAAERGAAQVGWAVTSGTLTTILSFFPILLLPNDSGTFMRSMPVTVVVTLFASLLLALTLTPLLASRWLKRVQCKVTQTPPQGTWLHRGLDRLSRGPYASSLAVAIRHPWLTLLGAVLILLGTLSLAAKVGVSLFPKAEKPMILVDIETPTGTSFEQTFGVAVAIEEAVRQEQNVVSVATNVGKGNPRIYYNIASLREQPNFAQLFVQINSSALSVVEPIVERLRERYKDYPHARVRVREFQQGPPYEAPVAIRVIGDELDKVRDMAAQVEAVFERTPGVINIDNPILNRKLDLRAHINRDKAALLGVPLDSIDRAIRTGLVGFEVAQYRDSEGEDYPILVRAGAQQEPRVEDLEHLFVRSNAGALVPLSLLVEMRLQSDLPGFEHYNMQRMALLKADVATGYETERVTNAVVEQLDALSWPPGVFYDVGGEQESRKESFSGVTHALILALFGIFAVLVLQFRSFLQPVIIFTAIPFAVTGAILALWITGYTFSFTALIGLTALVGIVVNNSIILVDYANQMRIEGMRAQEAILDAGITRFVPILLTTFTTAGGLLPLTLAGSSMWSPMGWSIIGGLLVSMLLTLLVVPVLYVLLTRDALPASVEGAVETPAA